MARAGHPQGAPLPDSGSITGVWPSSMQLPVDGACFDVQCRTMTEKVGKCRSMTECFLFFDLYACLRRSFLAVFCGLWAVDSWAIHRLTAALLRVQILCERE